MGRSRREEQGAASTREHACVMPPPAPALHPRRSRTMTRLAGPVAACAVCVPPCAAGAQPMDGYPARPVRIVTAAAAGSNDFAARLIGQELSARLGQPVIVDNRPGRFVAGDIVAKASADGHTLLFSGTTLWVGPLLHGRPSYDAVADFAPITLATRSPNVLVVHPSLAAR